MAIVFENDLINREISVGQTIKGSLKSITNTVDPYLLSLSKSTLVNVKFSVEQTVTEFDYYYLITPVGIFGVYPGYKGIPNEGITFVMNRNDSYGAGYYPFKVNGSYTGVFRDTYTLEITEASLPKFGLYVKGNETNLKQSYPQILWIIHQYNSSLSCGYSTVFFASPFNMSIGIVKNVLQAFNKLVKYNLLG